MVNEFNDDRISFDISPIKMEQLISMQQNFIANNQAYHSMVPCRNSSNSYQKMVDSKKDLQDEFYGTLSHGRDVTNYIKNSTDSERYGGTQFLPYGKAVQLIDNVMSRRRNSKMDMAVAKTVTNNLRESLSLRSTRDKHGQLKAIKGSSSSSLDSNRDKNSSNDGSIFEIHDSSTDGSIYEKGSIESKESLKRQIIENYEESKTDNVSHAPQTVLRKRKIDINNLTFRKKYQPVLVNNRKITDDDDDVYTREIKLHSIDAIERNDMDSQQPTNSISFDSIPVEQKDVAMGRLLHIIGNGECCNRPATSSILCNETTVIHRPENISRDIKIPTGTTNSESSVTKCGGSSTSTITDVECPCYVFALLLLTVILGFCLRNLHNVFCYLKVYGDKFLTSSWQRLRHVSLTEKENNIFSVIIMLPFVTITAVLYGTLWSLYSINGLLLRPISAKLLFNTKSDVLKLY